MTSFKIDQDLLIALDEYHHKTMLMEKHVVEKQKYDGDLQETIDDDLIYNVPIYDMGQRKYAAFCSFTEALWRKERDVKGNGYYFKSHGITDTIDWLMLFYLFRLCGSGINYKPKISKNFIGTHGFGNFWIVNSILRGRYTNNDWQNDLRYTEKPFSDNKGYILPQFTFDHIKSNHLKHFILNHSYKLVSYLYDYMNERRDIYQITDHGNAWLKKNGFKKQNFVLTAFAADVSEYFPNLVNKNGLVYAGTNATRCIKLIFPKTNKKVSEFDYINDVLQFQSKRYNLTPIDCEDSRNCDVVRYFLEYQSKYHIIKNNGKIYSNNTKLKKLWGTEKYQSFKSLLLK